MKNLTANENKKRASGLRKRLVTSRNARRRSERLLFVLLKTSRSLLTSLVTKMAWEGAARLMESKQRRSSPQPSMPVKIKS